MSRGGVLTKLVVFVFLLTGFILWMAVRKSSSPSSSPQPESPAKQTVNRPERQEGPPPIARSAEKQPNAQQSDAPPAPPEAAAKEPSDRQKLDSAASTATQARDRMEKVRSEVLQLVRATPEHKGAVQLAVEAQRALEGSRGNVNTEAMTKLSQAALDAKQKVRALESNALENDAEYRAALKKFLDAESVRRQLDEVIAAREREEAARAKALEQQRVERERRLNAPLPRSLSVGMEGRLGTFQVLQVIDWRSLLVERADETLFVSGSLRDLDSRDG
jgi:hypothetical protein